MLADPWTEELEALDLICRACAGTGTGETGKCQACNGTGWACGYFPWTTEEKADAPQSP